MGVVRAQRRLHRLVLWLARRLARRLARADAGAVLAIVLGVVHGAAAVCINEVLYDPAGADQGYEYVELFHAGPQPVDLAGWRLEAGNGAGPGEWRLQWKGSAGDVVAPGGFFLIADESVAAPADARVHLTLQNGPDAVRLLSPSGGGDRVGWGELAYAEYYEGRPALDAPSGSALARTVDGLDSDDNAADFRVEARLSPGTTNSPEWALLLGDVHAEPPVLDECHTGALFATLTNSGTRALTLTEQTLEVRAPAVRVSPPAYARTDLAPMQSTVVTWQVDGAGDSAVVEIQVVMRDPAGIETAGECRVRAGTGSVLIAELLYDPATDEGEWIELWNRDARAIDLAGWSISDATGRATRFIAPTLIPAGGRLIVAEAGDAFLAAHPEVLATDLVAREGAWPSLNNSVDPDLGYADEIVLTDGAGVPVDYVRYSPGSLDGDGVSLERWIEGDELVDPCALVPCPAPSGSSPGSALPDAPPADRGGLAPRPLIFYPDRADEAHYCRVVLEAPAAQRARVTADIYALDGTRVATLAAGAECAGPLWLTWDGRGAGGRLLPTGLYLVRALVRSGEPVTERRLVHPVALVRG
jgi:hypothetical protein